MSTRARVRSLEDRVAQLESDIKIERGQARKKEAFWIFSCTMQMQKEYILRRLNFRNRDCIALNAAPWRCADDMWCQMLRVTKFTSKLNLRAAGVAACSNLFDGEGSIIAIVNCPGRNDSSRRGTLIAVTELLKALEYGHMTTRDPAQVLVVLLGDNIGRTLYCGKREPFKIMPLP